MVGDVLAIPGILRFARKPQNGKPCSEHRAPRAVQDGVEVHGGVEKILTALHQAGSQRLVFELGEGETMATAACEDEEALGLVVGFLVIAGEEGSNDRRIAYYDSELNLVTESFTGEKTGSYRAMMVLGGN